ncbi:protein FAM217B isoform X2 [Myotis daubentonii]|uniref:protein FAM217B isoform X2 n=1 Tax=Myotis daubentonii TaxID=98922 RepID=UPI002872DDA2|nr:protein FAM217B isoform X2 [Myotis daubentonii]
MSESHQKSSSMEAGRSWNKVPRWKNASGKRQSESGGLPVPSRPKGSLLRVSPPAGEELGGSIFPEGKAKRSPLGPGCPGASGNKLLLDFQSLRLMKEDSEEDSASDLSDSERVPCPPSPRTPPDLRLRAEEIDPVCFDLELQPGQGHARPEYCYPDFLPPPCNSWDLRDMALLANTEPRPAPAPRAGGLLGKYVDRLVQLEWLQILTVQGERAKAAAKARLPPAPGTLPGPAGPLKSPGRSKPPASAGSRPHQDCAPKSGPSRKKGAPREGHPPHCWLETSAKPLDGLSTSRLCSQKHVPGARAEEKGSRSPRPRWDLAGSDSSRRMESSSNLRGPALPGNLDAADPPKTSRTQAHANPRKKGNADNCGQASVASEKKLRTNGGKQNPRKFK